MVGGKHLLALVPALVVATIVLAAARHKAFTIDDTLFLDQAVAASHDPRHPSAIDVTWFEDTQRLSNIMPSGPAMAWLLAPAVDDDNVDEATAHTISLLLALIAIVSTGLLAARLGASPRQVGAAAMLVATAPAVLGMAGTVMPDIAALAFGAVGVERAVAWRSDGRGDQLVVAVLALALGGLARLHALGLVAVAAVFVWQGGSRRRAAVIFVAPIVLAMAVMWWVRDPGGGNVGGSAQHFITWRSLDRNLPAFGIHWVVAMPLALPWLTVHGRRLRWRALWIAAPACAVLMICADLVHCLWLVPAACVGYLVIADIAWYARDRNELALALWLVVALPIALYINLAAKYVIVSAPAAAIVVARRVGPRTLVATCVLGLALGIAILRADARFAAVGRRAAAELVAPHVAGGERVWFLGHWGFQWYAERAGGHALTTAVTPLPDDIVVWCDVAARGVPELHVARELVGIVEDNGAGGRIMNKPAAAGFYSNMWGFLPWTWASSGTIERCDAWRVSR